ncbi:molybdate ABC transporter substrate-binding protein [Ramlibacter aquaticus]|uniref:Molybdate ABC transporter substrate-binding protein n=2 Tax=Comamonadaceae TaxID=80864 RepID=A0ABR9SCM2_9BURK|nr:molybdate ABC transporter substrate-binding protein [Ramlibacter aquaticus]
MLASAATHTWAQTSVTIAAASDLKFALDVIVAGYEKSTGRAVRVTYGSSGNFARQLEQGAPFDMFMSADEGFVKALATKGLTADEGALYASGRIVLFSPSETAFTPDPGMEGLKAALAQGRVRKFAIANPEHAPYGRAAMQALQAKGLWTQLEPKLVMGENVSQAAQFAASGSTEGGIFALSLALSPNFGGRGKYAVLPEPLHQPLRQRMVLMRRAVPEARAFYEYLQGPAARDVFKRFGFRLPGE